MTDGGAACARRSGNGSARSWCINAARFIRAGTCKRHLAKPYRNEAHRKLTTALAQTSYADAKRMLLELATWLRTKNESAADSLLEAFEELLMLHRLKVPALLRQTRLSTNPIESLFSLVRHSARNITCTRGSARLQRWLGTVLRDCEQPFNRVKGCAGIAQVLATIEAEHAEPQSTPTKKAA